MWTFRRCAGALELGPRNRDRDFPTRLLLRKLPKIFFNLQKRLSGEICLHHAVVTE